MKQIKFIMLYMVLTIVCVSCRKPISFNKNTKIEIEVIDYNDSVVITRHHNDERELKEGFAYGLVEDVLKIYGVEERAMLNGFREYTESFIYADMKRFKRYFNNDVFYFFKKVAKKDGVVLDIDDFIKKMNAESQRFFYSMRKNGYKIKPALANLKRRINYENHILIIFTNTINLIDKNNLTVHFIPFENTIGISKDNGRSWTFANIYEELPAILAEVYPKEVIDAIMN